MQGQSALNLFRMCVFRSSVLCIAMKSFLKWEFWNYAFSFSFFADTSHQARLVSHRPYYTLPNSSHERRSVLTITEPPRFHFQAKGKNIRLDAHSRKATRRNSFCNGITFTNRPIHLYEKVRLKLVSVHHGWSGALRFGFTTHDPSQMSADDIPKYACPDLVTRPGFWAKALPERFALRDNVLAFWVDRHGRVFYSINDEEPILFHCGVKVSGPLWALIDVYGITHEVQILGRRIFFNKYSLYMLSFFGLVICSRSKQMNMHHLSFVMQ